MIVTQEHRIKVYLGEVEADIVQQALMQWRGPYRDGETLTQEERNRVIELTDQARALGHSLQHELTRIWYSGTSRV